MMMSTPTIVTNNCMSIALYRSTLSTTWQTRTLSQYCLRSVAQCRDRGLRSNNCRRQFVSQFVHGQVGGHKRCGHAIRGFSSISRTSVLFFKKSSDLSIWTPRLSLLAKYQQITTRTSWFSAPSSNSIRSSSRKISSLLSTESLSKKENETINRLVNDISNKNINTDNDENDPSSQRMRQRIALAKAITLVESKSPTRRLMADVLLDRLRKSASISPYLHESNTATETESSTLEHYGKTSTFRLGIAGPPGVGKSTFVEALGLYILGLKENDTLNDENIIKKPGPTESSTVASSSTTSQDSFAPEKMAVLCIDPSSHITGGSILGDKTRMPNLSCHQRAYVRPSPSSGTLGGLGSYTHDAVSLCEFAGYSLTIVETVGVGQSEVELAECVDMFLLLLAPGGGDELQGSKKGIVEVADVLVVNKADGEYGELARRTASEYKKAMGLMRKPAGWWGKKGENENDCSEGNENTGAPVAPPVLLISAKTGYGIPELWSTIDRYRQYSQSSSYLIDKRRRQNRYWMWKYLREHVLETAKKDPRVKTRAGEIERNLDCGLLAPRVAAGELWRSIMSRSDDELE